MLKLTTRVLKKRRFPSEVRMAIDAFDTLLSFWGAWYLTGLSLSLINGAYPFLGFVLLGVSVFLPIISVICVITAVIDYLVIRRFLSSQGITLPWYKGWGLKKGLASVKQDVKGFQNSVDGITITEDAVKADLTRRYSKL